MSELPTFETILLDVDAEGVALLTFHRPAVRNALNLTMVEEVRAALNLLSLRGDLGALIVAGSEKAFVSGADIAELKERTHADALRRINSDLFREIERFPAPTIAALRGWALGGGCELALACDLRVCGEGAKLGQPEVSLGIIPGAGATYRLPRLVGLGCARELIFTGRIIGAEEALRIGLVNRVVPDAEVLDAARALAGEIAKQGTQAVRLAKLALNQGWTLGVDAGQALESVAQAILFDDPEKHRRMEAFLQRKRRKQGGGGPQLRVRGLDGAELLLDHEALRAFSAEAQVPDVTVIDPERRGSAVRFPAIAARLGPAPAAVRLRSRGGFEAAQPYEVMQRGVIVYAHEGRPLPEELGGPFRLLIEDAPDRCANVKALETVELLAEPLEA